MARLRIVSTVLALALFEAPDAAADELETAQLTYVNGGATRCPDEESFRLKVAARLGYQPFTPDGKHRVSVKLTIANGHVRAHGEVLRKGESAPGVRDLDGDLDHCEPVAAALATAVAIALDPVRSTNPAPPPPPRAAEPEAPKAVAPPPAAPPPSAVDRASAPSPLPPEPKSHVVAFGSVGVLGMMGAMPGPALGGGVGVGLRYERVSMELSGRFETTPGTARVGTGDRLEATMLSALVAPCGHFGRWLACGLGRLGSLQGYAADVVHPSLGSSLFGAVGARGGYEFPLSSLVALRALASAELAVVRTSFVIDDRPIWTAPPLFGGLELGLSLSLP